MFNVPVDTGVLYTMTKLQVKREEHFSREELTKLTGLGPQTIRHYEQGFRSIDGANIKTLAKIARALNCRLSDLVEDPETVTLLEALNQ